MEEREFDLVVVGAGPGGYVAAIRAAQLGMKVACVDKRGAWGGTCLHVGCIPSKALLHSSRKLEEARGGLGAHGIDVGGVGFDPGRMMARKDKIVADLAGGIELLFRKNGVAAVAGAARIAAPGRVEVSGGAGAGTYAARRVLVATGSASAPLAGVAVDEERILSSTGALSLRDVPGSMVVIGGGYIGLELGSVWRRLGARVTVVELGDSLVPGMDAEIGRALRRILGRQGLAFRLGVRVAGARRLDAGGVALDLEAAGGGRETVEADAALVAAGRVPFADGLGLEALGVARDGRGAVRVDEAFRTSVAGVHAVGDVVPGPMLAHKAEAEGVACVERMAGRAGRARPDVIPSVVYTWPEAASVGRTEEELAGADVRVGRFPLAANPRARVSGETEGFVKILADAGTDEVLGAHVVGPEAGTMIAELALAMEFGASSEDVARTCHAHPTLGEAVKEAALAAGGAPIHS